MTNNRISESQNAIADILSKWRAERGQRPDELNFAVLELAKQCRIAWEHRCDAIFSGRREQSSSVIRDLERQLIVSELYERVTAAARRLANAKAIAHVQGDRREFEKLYWGELHFVESERLNSKAVESTMVSIRESLVDWHEGPAPQRLTMLWP